MRAVSQERLAVESQDQPLASATPVARLTGGDLWGVVARSFLLQALWNRERMQGQGFAFALRPVARRLAGREGEAAWLARHLGYFNTHPVMASYALGAVARLEEDRAAGLGPDEPTLDRVKASLGPALAAVGDPLFWSTLRPFAAATGVWAVLSGSAWGPMWFLLLYNLLHLPLRVRGVFRARRLGLEGLGERMRRRLGRVSSGLHVAGVVAAAALFEIVASRAAGTGRGWALICAVLGLLVGWAWGEGRRVSSATLGLGLFVGALAWATWAP